MQVFEGGVFHVKYLDFLESEADPSEHLKDIEVCRIYKNLPDKSSALSSKISLKDAMGNLAIEK